MEKQVKVTSEGISVYIYSARHNQYTVSHGSDDEFFSTIFMRNSLDLVVTQKVKTWTQGIVRAQWNEPNRCITKHVL